MSVFWRIRGVHAKIERAKKHIADADIAIRAFCDSEPYTLSTEHRDDIDHVRLKVAEVREVPDTIALIVGYCIHNLRSSLDHLMWQLVEASGGTPNKNTHFPICKSPQQYASAIGKGEIKKIPVGAEKLLHAVQPDVAYDDTLWHIHDLDRMDKHRLIVTVATYMFGWNMKIAPTMNMFWDAIPVPLEPGHEVVNMPTGSFYSVGQENFKLGLNVAFGQSEIVRGKLVLPTLNEMAEFVGNVVAGFEAFLV